MHSPFLSHKCLQNVFLFFRFSPQTLDIVVTSEAAINVNFSLEIDALVTWSKDEDFDIKENMESTEYLTHQQMASQLEKLANESSNIMEYIVIEKSPMGNPIPLVHLSLNITKHETSKPHILLIGGLHGNETVGAELLMRFVRHQLTG